MKKIFIILSIIITLIISNKENDKVYIPKDSIRIRVIANSNSIVDQELKLKVKSELENNLYQSMENVRNINEARNEINSNLDEINNIVHDILKNDNYSINYGYNYFPKKEYKGVVYEEGNYESLVVTLGSGSGKNWWCILFPPLCMMEAKKDNINDIQYKSKVLEILNNYN